MHFFVIDIGCVPRDDLEYVQDIRNINLAINGKIDIAHHPHVCIRIPDCVRVTSYCLLKSIIHLWYRVYMALWSMKCVIFRSI